MSDGITDFIRESGEKSPIYFKEKICDRCLEKIVDDYPEEQDEAKAKTKELEKGKNG